MSTSSRKTGTGRKTGERKTGTEKKSATARKKLSTERKAKRLKERTAITPEERDRKIAEAAYLKAESRGFQGSSPEQDWYEAAAEIDAMFSRPQRSRRSAGVHRKG